MLEWQTFIWAFQYLPNGGPIPQFPSSVCLLSKFSSGSVIAGLLVYNALVNLIVPQYPPVNISHRPWLELGKYLALTLGYTAMAVIANWA